MVSEVLLEQVCIGLGESDLDDVFDTVVGVSAGSGNSAYFLAGQSVRGASLWHECSSDKQLINNRRFWRVLDMGYGEYLMRNVKVLDQEAIRESRSDFFIGVTVAETGEGKYLDAKDGVDIVTAVHASSAIPVIYNQTVNIAGVQYGDGAIGNGVPIDKAIQNGSTDILVVLNNLIDEEVQFSRRDKLMIRLYMLKFSAAYRDATLATDDEYSNLSDAIGKAGDINIGVIVPTRMPISRLSSDHDAIISVVQDGKDAVLNLFTQ